MIPVPEMKLDVVDAAELAEMLQFLSQWLARDPGRLASPWHSSSAIPPTAWPSCVMTWSGSSSCSAAATASPSLTLARLSKAPHHDQPAGSESTGFAAAHPRARRAAAGPSPGFDKGTLARTLIGPCGQVASLPDRPESLRVLAPCQIPAQPAPSPPPPSSTTNQEMIDPVNRGRRRTGADRPPASPAQTTTGGKHS